MMSLLNLAARDELSVVLLEELAVVTRTFLKAYGKDRNNKFFGNYRVCTNI